MNIINTHLPKRLNKNNIKVIHVLFWIIVTIIFLFDRVYLIAKAGLPNFLICAAVRISLLVAIAYLNLYYLMPKFLARGKYISYVSLVILIIIAYIFIQSLYDLYLFGYILGPTKKAIPYAALLYNTLSTVWYLILTVSLKLSIDWYEQKQDIQKVAIEKLRAEVNYLRTQVNPHFLFNVLNSLYSLTMKKSDLAPGMVLKLSEMMEYMLYESDDPYVPLETELNYLKNYLELEQMRQGNHADISLHIEGSAEGKQIAPFMLLPLVENAFKHGVSKIIDNAWLHINIHILPDELIFTVENNRLNIHPVGSHQGIGLPNLKQRLQLLYPEKHTLSIHESENEFKLSLKMML